MIDDGCGEGAMIVQKNDAADTAVIESAGLVAEGITKTFGSTVALDDVSMRFTRGAVHGLIGENGSGKSTFVKIVAGIHRSDRGQVAFDGVPVATSDGAVQRGVTVACVYQDGSLIEELTVTQNIDLMIESNRRDAFEPSNKWRRNLLDRFGLESVDLSSRVGDIPNNEQRLVEIACVLAKRPAVVLFDESTSTLDQRGVDRVLQSMHHAADDGACVLFVTHRLREVLSVAEDITVLRDGAVVAELATDTASEELLVQHMAGREIAAFTRRAVKEPDGEVVLKASDLAAPHCGPISLTVTRGEVVGIGGAAGNGQAELIRALAGEGIIRGEVVVVGKPMRRPEDGLRASAIFVSSDRRFESLSSLLSIRENYTLALEATSGSWWSWLSRRREVSEATALADRYGLVRKSIEQPVASLSGGNQQKVAISRAIARKPALLLIEEPTQGVDVRSRLDIYRALALVADSGTAVVFTSSDASELRSLADRVVVMARGRQVAELYGLEVTEEAIVHAFSTATERVESPSGVDLAAQTAEYRPRARPSGGQYAWRPSTFVMLALIIFALGAYATSKDQLFATAGNVGGIFLLSLPLVLVAIAQLPVLMVGEIDASLGSMMGLIVVILSFMPDTSVVLLFMIGVVGGAVMGAVNAFLVVKFRITAVIATIATLGIFLGVGRIIRPTPGGLISLDLSTSTHKLIGSVPVFFLVVVALALLADVYMNRSRLGLRTRAVGYSADRAIQLGVQSVAFRAVMYVIAGAIAGLAGVALAAQTGVGDAGVGSGYVLLSLAVPVIGGAALSGGRGSAIGCILAALFVAEVQIFIPFMNLPSGGYLIAVGVLTTIALYVGTQEKFSIRTLLTRMPHGKVRSID
jgi:ribose transport system ATP-binding protein